MQFGISVLQRNTHQSIDIDLVGVRICRHTLKMAAMTSFEAEKCCQLVNEREICVRQLLMYSTYIRSCCFNAAAAFSVMVSTLHMHHRLTTAY